ncbi:F-box/kelch-repeat protein At1g57790-like isoform X2 [Carex rostrata]
MTCWSDMAYDALERITSFLPLKDYHRFSAVCKNWRLVAKQKRHSPAPQLPWLVLGDEPGTGKRMFYNLSEDKHYAMDIPELYGRYICGSSHGWLVAIDIKLTGILINPFTREFYELPLFPHYNIGLSSTSIFENALMDYRDVAGQCIEDIQVSIVQKAILSHDPKERPDFMLMILVGISVPAFWKPGDSSWTVIRVTVPGIKDVIYFDGHFYFLTNKNALLFLDFQPDPKVHDIRSPRIRLRRRTAQSYLVNYFGNLLLVERWDQFCVKKRHYKTCYFNILRLDFEKEKVYRSKTIGGKQYPNLFLASISLTMSCYCIQDLWWTCTSWFSSYTGLVSVSWQRPF